MFRASTFSLALCLGLAASVAAQEQLDPRIQVGNQTSGMLASQTQTTPTSNDGMRNALKSTVMSSGGTVFADPSYALTERIGYLLFPSILSSYMPSGSRLKDERGGVLTNHYRNPVLNPYTNFYAAETTICHQDTLVGYSSTVSGVSPQSACSDRYFFDYTPGNTFANGNPGPSKGWYLPTAERLSIVEAGAGLHTGRSEIGLYSGVGDINPISRSVFGKGALITPSDEGGHLVDRNDLHEGQPGTATITVGGTGAFVLGLSGANNLDKAGWGVGHPIIELGSGAGVVTGTCSNAGSAASNAYITVVTCSNPLPVSKANGVLTVETDVNPVVSGAATAATVYVPSGTSVAVGDLFQLFGRTFERAAVTSVGAASGGLIPVGMNLSASHGVGEQFCVAGGVGRFIEATADTHVESFATYRYVQRVVCSPPDSYTTSHAGLSETFWIGEQFNNAPAWSTWNGANQPFAVYYGSDVSDVRDMTTDSTTGKPFNTMTGNHFFIKDNNAPWAAGDAVQNTNTIIAGYDAGFTNLTVFNPYIPRIGTVRMYYGRPSYVGGADHTADSSNLGLTGFYDQTSDGTAGGTHGRYLAPFSSQYKGVWGGFVWDHPPMSTDAQHVGALLRVTGGFLPGDPRTSYPLHYDDSSGGGFSYSPSTFTHSFNHNLSVASLLSTQQFQMSSQNIKMGYTSATDFVSLGYIKAFLWGFQHNYGAGYDYNESLAVESLYVGNGQIRFLPVGVDCTSSTTDCSGSSYIDGRSNQDVAEFHDHNNALTTNAVWSAGRLRVVQHTPASSSENCVTGDWLNDPNYVYVCVATNTWKRSALGTF